MHIGSFLLGVIVGYFLGASGLLRGLLGGIGG